MGSVVDAPAPPYYAVIAPAELHDDVRGYPELAARLVDQQHEVHPVSLRFDRKGS